ncbi:hypothetical protein CHOCRA_000061 [Candidatus Hodgkinia cicadicola]|nr:hypothetical protein CHOCRA_000061 [Candidatus Hodgkinia cicadicola]
MLILFNCDRWTNRVCNSAACCKQVHCFIKNRVCKLVATRSCLCQLRGGAQAAPFASNFVKRAPAFNIKPITCFRDLAKAALFGGLIRRAVACELYFNVDSICSNNYSLLKFNIICCVNPLIKVFVNGVLGFFWLYILLKLFSSIKYVGLAFYVCPFKTSIAGARAPAILKELELTVSKLLT